MTSQPDTGGRRRSVCWLLLAAGVLLTSCGDGPGRSARVATSAPDTITVTSSAFGEDAWIPRELTCDGTGAMPPLRWSGVPAGTESLAVVMRDPDAPNGTYTHWLIADLAPAVDAITAPPLPAHAVQAVNSAGSVGYTPPCPPKGPAHRYRFTVVALDTAQAFDAGAATDAALAAVDGHAIARGTLTARYRRG